MHLTEKLKKKKKKKSIFLENLAVYSGLACFDNTNAF
jgi:hypothetical protein